jgi:hypothetical protein
MEDKKFPPSAYSEDGVLLPSRVSADEWLADYREELRDLERLIAEYNAIQDLKYQLASASSKRR